MVSPLCSSPWSSSLAIVLMVALGGCLGSDQAPPRPDKRAKGRKGDPVLLHQWKMAANMSVLESADLGSEPPALADALMTVGAAPKVSHQIVTECASKGALANTATVALRWKVAEGGEIESLEGDPPGEASSCVVEAFGAELSRLDALPPGSALMVLHFHPKKPR